MKIDFMKELLDMGHSIEDLIHVPMYPKIHSWDVFEECLPLKCRKAVDYFVKSDIPNEAFFQFFRNPYKQLPQEWEWLREKRYWSAIAYIMVKRGLPKIIEVKKDLLHWYEDVNWPGALLVNKFVIENGVVFLPDVAETFLAAYYKRDYLWMVWLLDMCYKKINPALTEEQKQQLEEFIEYLYDGEPWLDMEERYSSLVYEIAFHW